MTEGTLSQFFSRIAPGNPPLTMEDMPLVDSLLSRYPFFTLPAALMLDAPDISSEQRSHLMAAVALNAPDSASLMKLVDPDGRRFAEFYPAEPEPETPTTTDALDTFLDTYGSADPHETALLERLIFNPVPDYSQVLAREAEPAEGPVSEQDALLDAFLARHDETVRQAVIDATPAPTPQAMPKPRADQPLSETLAKMYIKQQRFDKAYEIISQLSLNNPKKSVYFADQMRFLKKLMLIQEAANGKNK